MTADIIPFPSDAASPARFTEEDTPVILQRLRRFHVEEIADFVISVVYDQLFSAGVIIDPEAPEYKKDAALFQEIFKAMLTRYYGGTHPRHGLSDQLFDEDSDGDLDLSEVSVIKRSEVIDIDRSQSNSSC